MRVDITTKTIEELKVMAYDVLTEKSRIDHNLLVLQKEIESRIKEAVKPLENINSNSVDEKL